MNHLNLKELRKMTQRVKINRLRSLGLVTAGAAVFYVGFTAYRNKDMFYRSFVMPAVRLFPAETSHNLAVWACKHRIYPPSDNPDDVNLHTSFFGHMLSNPVGIAAGFDKNGEAILGLSDLGFGFVEIGTVTPAPQAGNPKPRVFRLSDDNAIINRYGFNSEGYQPVVARLRQVRNMEDFNCVIGVNLGQNRRTRTPADDYVRGVQIFGALADYLVINVSSPNTRGLRDLQAKDKLKDLLTAVNTARANLRENKNVPILLKLSPDLTLDDMKDIVNVISKKNSRVDGLIVANTTITRDNLKDTKLAAEPGGLSGEPLRDRSTQMIAQMYNLTQGRIPIIGVGGVASGRDAMEKIEAGASFVQIYTALVYQGPPLVERLKEELSTLVTEKGFTNVREMVGSNYKQYLLNQQTPAK